MGWGEGNARDLMARATRLGRDSAAWSALPSTSTHGHGGPNAQSKPRQAPPLFPERSREHAGRDGVRGSGSGLDGRRGARAGQVDGRLGEWPNRATRRLCACRPAGRVAGGVAVPRCLPAGLGWRRRRRRRPSIPFAPRRASPPRRELAGRTGIIAHLHGMPSPRARGTGGRPGALPATPPACPRAAGRPER